MQKARTHKTRIKHALTKGVRMDDALMMQVLKVAKAEKRTLPKQIELIIQQWFQAKAQQIHATPHKEAR